MYVCINRYISIYLYINRILLNSAPVNRPASSITVSRCIEVSALRGGARSREVPRASACESGGSKSVG